MREMKLSELNIKFIPKRWAVVFIGMLLAIFSVGVYADLLDTTTQSAPHDFTHMETGFPLLGAHRGAECVSCHVSGLFKGTPRNCSGCHSKGKRIVTTVMPNNHVATTDECDSCHTNTVTFSGARFNHTKSAPGSCASCHNGIISTGKPASHNGGLRVTQSCEKCHRTYAWNPATFNHTGIAPGNCSQCHDGNLATGRPGSHRTALKSTATCDTCHRFSAWYPTFYNHTSVAPGTCLNCHDSVSATGRPASHTGLKATMVCDQCHNTRIWTPARYSHSGVAGGSCATCHNGASAIGKPSSHMGAKATLACDSCHNTSAWSPAFYNHAGVAAGSCSTCHAVQRPTSHASRGYIGSCDACHTIGSSWAFNHALQQGKHTCNNCHSGHHNSTPCDNCHTVNSWGH
jgi:hypothetical protein